MHTDPRIQFHFFIFKSARFVVVGQWPEHSLISQVKEQ